MPDTEYIYIKDEINLTEYALDFMEDEVSYYPTIKSYTREEKVALFICVNGVISCSGYYTDDGELYEYFRDDVSTDKVYSSIQEWCSNYYDNDELEYNKILNTVFIGEDMVPLWKVLLDEKDSDGIIEETNEPLAWTPIQITLLVTFLSSMLGLFTLILIISRF